MHALKLPAGGSKPHGKSQPEPRHKPLNRRFSIAVWLIDRFASPLAHTFYLIAAAIVSTVVIWTMRETAHEELG